MTEADGLSEIERTKGRLRKFLYDARQMHRDACELADDHDRLKAENERLRAIIEERAGE
jgi:hypothetical protein